MLTRELAVAAVREQDNFRARALIESALEVAPVPRHRAALLGMLVRMQSGPAICRMPIAGWPTSTLG